MKIDHPVDVITTQPTLPPAAPIPRGSEVVLPSSVAQYTVQLTHGPRSKWGTLSQLELIKERNKPVEPPKEPEKAPFFLTTTPGLTPEFVNLEKEERPEGESRFVKREDVLSVENDLQRLLREASERRWRMRRTSRTWRSCSARTTKCCCTSGKRRWRRWTRI